MKKTILYIIGIFLCFYSCSKPKPISQKGTKYVKVKVNVFDNHKILKTQIKENYIVKLETNNDCLIGDINRLRVDDDRIFILDSKISEKLFVFNKSGKYLFNVGKKGQGPGEYYSINDFFIDKKEKKIIIYDANQRNLHYYNWDGKYVKTHSFSGIWMFACCPLDSNLFAIDFTKKASTNKYHLEYLDQKNKVQSVFKPLEMDYELANNFHIAFYKGIENNIFYVPTRCDTIFNISNKGINGGYAIDFGKYTYPIKEYKNLRKKEQVESLLNSKYCYGIQNVLETSKILFFNFSFGPNKFPLFYNKHTESTYSVLLYYPQPKAVDSDNYFVGIYESYLVNPVVNNSKNLDYCKEWKKNIGDRNWKYLEQMKSSDNPLLFFYKIEL